jgi:Ca-activated chloride channel family protein
VSLAAPLWLLALIAVPALAGVYIHEQRNRVRAAQAFATAPMLASVAPRRPGWRRHLPHVLMALGLTALILALARPQYPVTKPVKGAAVMFANDISDSMQATDVKPSRLMAAKRAAISFLAQSTNSIEVGSVAFARHPTLLQSPTRDHALTRAAISKLAPGGGGTAIGEAIELALGAIGKAPKIGGKRPPGAVILISDGVSNVGVSPLVAARVAKRQHVRIYTVSIGTANGEIQLKRGGRIVTSKVPVDPTELREIANASGGDFYRAADSTAVHDIYTRLATKLGQRRVESQLDDWVAGLGLMLVLIGIGTSLRWFARLA